MPNYFYLDVLLLLMLMLVGTHTTYLQQILGALDFYPVGYPYGYAQVKRRRNGSGTVTGDTAAIAAHIGCR